MTTTPLESLAGLGELLAVEGFDGCDRLVHDRRGTHAAHVVRVFVVNVEPTERHRPVRELDVHADRVL